jgi:hypothetical protein
MTMSGEVVTHPAAAAEGIPLLPRRTVDAGWHWP